MERANLYMYMEGVLFSGHKQRQKTRRVPPFEKQKNIISNTTMTRTRKSAQSIFSLTTTQLGLAYN